MAITLPSTPTKADAGKAKVLIYGQPKIGKTTFASKFPKPLFVCTESGHDALDLHRVDVTSWKDFLEVCALLTGKHDFKTIVIDTIDNALSMCQQHVCNGMGIKHPSDAAYGKGFGAVADEYERVFNRLAMMPLNIVIISHAKDVELDSRLGKYSKTVPSLAGKARDYFTGMADIILFAELQTAHDKDGNVTGEKRIVHASPSKHFDAGDRFGKLPSCFPLDYAAFDKAMKGEKNNG